MLNVQPRSLKQFYFAISEDSGQEVIKMSAPTHFSSSVRSQIQIPDDQDLDVISLMKKVRYKFQPVTFGPAECLEEGSCYDRRHLYTTFTHRLDTDIEYHEHIPVKLSL
jgi:hypothetical protein